MADSSESDLTKLGTRAVQLADKGEASSIELFDELVRRIQQLPDSAQISLALAQALFYRGRAYSTVVAALDLDRAAVDLNRARRIYVLFSDTRHEAECLGQLGVVAVQRYEREVQASGARGRASDAYCEAERLWKASLAISQDQAAVGTNLVNLADLYSIGNEWSLARSAYSQLLIASETRGDAQAAARASLGLALSLASLGKRRLARRVVKETMRRSAAVGPSGNQVGQAARRLLEQLS